MFYVISYFAPLLVLMLVFPVSVVVFASGAIDSFLLANQCVLSYRLFVVVVGRNRGRSIEVKCYLLALVIPSALSPSSSDSYYSLAITNFYGCSI